jgi:hypothetical protein
VEWEQFVLKILKMVPRRAKPILVLTLLVVVEPVPSLTRVFCAFLKQERLVNVLLPETLRDKQTAHLNVLLIYNAKEPTSVVQILAVVASASLLSI